MPWWRGRRLGIGALPVEDKNFSHLLDRVRLKRVADFRNQTFALASVLAQDADLDQFVALQGEINLAQHRCREAGATDHDHGMEMMRLCPETSPLRWREFLHVRESSVVSRQSCCRRYTRRGVTTND